MSADELDKKIRALVAEDLHLEAGEMMMPIKAREIEYLVESIHGLVAEVAREATQ